MLLFPFFLPKYRLTSLIFRWRRALLNGDHKLFCDDATQHPVFDFSSSVIFPPDIVYCAFGVMRRTDVSCVHRALGIHECRISSLCVQHMWGETPFLRRGQHFAASALHSLCATAIMRSIKRAFLRFCSAALPASAVHSFLHGENLIHI